MAVVTVFGSALALLRVVLLFAVTAVAEIVGCYLPWLVIKQGRPLWLLLPAAASGMDPKRNGTGSAQHPPVFLENRLGFSPCLGVIHGG